MNPAPLFAYMHERHMIHLRRSSKMPLTLGQWTDDWILQTYRFCNVYRELDRTTIWLRDHVRDVVDLEHVMLAVTLFRWFNRISTGEAIFTQGALGLAGELPGEAAWDAMLRMRDVSPVRASIVQYCGDGPYVTGSYIIKTPDGLNKLDGVIWCIEQFMEWSANMDGPGTPLDQWELSRYMVQTAGTDRQLSLEQVWRWLRQLPFLGDFMAYEIVTDLRHTPLLGRAPDIYTWANPGPGAMRGLSRLAGRPLDKRLPREVYIEEMRKLLAVSEDRELWPGEWPSLEMRDIEHSLCEFDKYERARCGQGSPRQKFRG